MTKALRCLAAALIVCIPLTSHGQDRTLEEIARHTRVASYEGLILSDIATTRREIAPFANRVEPEVRAYLPLKYLNPGPALDAPLLVNPERPMKDAMGFDFHDVESVASWGRPPETAVVLTLNASLDRIQPALAVRGFAIRDLIGQEVWYRGDDNGWDIQQRNQDPFSGGMGLSTRFAAREGRLYVSRTWVGLTYMLSQAPTVADEPATSALLDAAYTSRMPGHPIQLHRFDDRPSRDQIVAGGQLPPFEDWAIVQWEEGLDLSAGLLLLYQDADSAAVAIEKFETLLDGSNAADGTPLASILDFPRTTQVIDTRGAHIALTGFASPVPDKPVITREDLGNNAIARLFTLYFRDDLPVLIGTDP